MDKPATHPLRNSLGRFYPWLIVLLVLLFVGFIRVRLLEMPLERDEGEYAYAGQLILQGIPPYELAYNMKLPGTYFAYAIGMAIFGQSTAGIHLTLIVVNSLTIIFVFLLGRKLFGIIAGLVACASYAIMSVSPAVLGMAAHANHFVVLFAVPATLLLWNADGRRKILFFSGLLYGLAFLMKQQGIFFELFGWIIFVAWQMQKKPVGLVGFAKKSFAFGLGMVLPFALTCLYLERAGVFSKFWFWTFTYARSYVTALPWLVGEQLLNRHLMATFFLSAGLWILAATGLLLALRNKTIQKQTSFAMAFWFFSFLATATGFYFRQHYFILLLPAFALLIGLAVSSLEQALRDRVKPNTARLIPLIFFIMILSWNIVAQSGVFFQMSGKQASQCIYPQNPFVEAVAAGKYIREHASPNARFAVIGSEPEIYFYARRHSATGYIYTYALMEPQPYAAQMQREMEQEIESAQPEYLVYVLYDNSWLFSARSNMGIFDWLKKYSDKFYERVGVVDTRPTGEIIYLWGDDIKKFTMLPRENYLVIYKRKTEMIPAGKD